MAEDRGQRAMGCTSARRDGDSKRRCEACVVDASVCRGRVEVKEG
jgi:hypothetical protein